MNKFLRWRWLIFLAGVIVFASAVTAGYIIRDIVSNFKHRVNLWYRVGIKNTKRKREGKNK